MKPLPPSDWDDALRPIIDDMNGRPLNIHALMANHPRLLDAWWDLRQYLVDGGDLDRRHCELVILRIAAHMKSWYEWASHVVRGLDSGLTLDEIERVGDAGGSWDEPDAALLRSVDEIVTEDAISTATLERLAAHFSGRQVMDVVLLHGMYRTIACLINTWGLELDEHVRAKLPAGVSESSFTGQ